MRGQHRHGMARRAAERLPVHPRHDPQRVYTGVPLRTSAGRSGRADQRRKWILPEGADASAMTAGRSRWKRRWTTALSPSMNGERAAPRTGLSDPPRRARLGRQHVGQVAPPDRGRGWPWHHREETSKYTDLLEDGNARRFTWVMDAKSVITNPSPQAPITHGPGPTVITGVAWSGRGTIPRVDVSLDGGMNWHQRGCRGRRSTGQGDAPLLLHRLGRLPLLLQSRAHDETGYVQPTKESCARCAARTRSITTTASRPGPSTKTAGRVEVG
jgi:sulfane dehydrogenase subunit SoxC